MPGPWVTDVRAQRLLPALLALAVGLPALAETTGTALERARAVPHVDGTFGRFPLYFVENRGQLDGRVAYYTTGGTSAYFTADGITFAFTKQRERPAPAATGMTLPTLGQAAELPGTTEAKRWAVAIDLDGARRSWPEGGDLHETIVSYFKGPKDQWKVALPTWLTVAWREVWPGIDLTYSGASGQMKYTFVVQPGGDPAAIRLRYRGATSVRVSAEGELLVETPLGGIRDQVPVVWQEGDGCREDVTARHVLERDGPEWVASFEVDTYDHTRPLVIDPIVLAYCGYIGGTMSDMGAYGLAADANGHLYTGGRTSSADLPVVVGPDLTWNGGEDAFVARVNPSGTTLDWLGYLGGDRDEGAWGLAADAAENVYLAGSTGSAESTLPVTIGPDLTYNGGEDAFVAKVDPTGTALIYAGYVGGSNFERAFGLAVDSSGHAVVSGQTYSADGSFPAAVGPDLSYNGGPVDCFVAKVNSAGDALQYAGYIGGVDEERGAEVAVDGAGGAYVVAHTASNEATFPVTIGPDLTHAGNTDSFVAKVSRSGAALDYCGYIGGSADDPFASVAVDLAGSAYVTGLTLSDQATFPVSVGPDLTANGSYDAFVAKVTVTGDGFVYGGYIGGASSDDAFAVAVDAGGSAYVAGATTSTESTFPVRDGPDLTYNGGLGGEGFVARVTADGTDLLFCGYIGGAASDEGAWSAALDGTGGFYVGGYTVSDESTFPVVVGPDLTHNGGHDAFVAKLVERSCATAAAPIEGLLATRQAASPDDVALSWLADPLASGYNVWHVTTKAKIPLARQASQPPALPVVGCATPTPAGGTSCIDAGGVGRGSPAVFFYQVRASCSATEEGP